MIKKLAEILFLLLLLLAGYTLVTEKPEQPVAAESNLTVHFIDVGQADCTLLECDGKFMLIDGGNVEDNRKVVAYLQRHRVSKLDAVVCTHAHEDHVGGLAAVLAVYPVEAVYAPATTYAAKPFEDFRKYADQQELEIQIPEPGTVITLGSAEITVLGPVKSYEDVNNTSLVLRAVYGETSFLFTGDMELEAETDLLDQGTDVRADVLHVGHHGSETSTSYRFLYEVEPRFAVISVGEDNSYGHPHEQVLSRLRDAGVTVYRTDDMGTIVAASDGTAISFVYEKE